MNRFTKRRISRVVAYQAHQVAEQAAGRRRNGPDGSILVHSTIRKAPRVTATKAEYAAA
jgi:hypothetical protein